jgi:hypothetical protein
MQSQKNHVQAAAGGHASLESPWNIEKHGSFTAA